MTRQMLVTFALFLLLTGCHYEYVEQGPAVAVADKFYASLQAKNIEGGMLFFSPHFRETVTQWPWFLTSLQERFGQVSSAKLELASLGALEHSPCYKLTYAVKRDSLVSDEILLVCRMQGSNAWSIEGHKMTRLDNMQSAFGGMIPVEKAGIHVP